jgi:hypothetical protein
VEVYIQEVVTNVRAVDGTTVLDARTMGQIVRAVLVALDAQKAQEARRVADTGTAASRSGQER